MHLMLMDRRAVTPRGRSPGSGRSGGSGPKSDGTSSPFDLDERFAGLVRPILPELVRVARRILGSDDLAWDAVQEGLLSLWQQDEPPPNPRAWLLRAVLHRSLHQARMIRRRRNHEARACRSRTEAWHGDPARSVIDEELREALREALARLAEPHRVVLSLHLIDELDYRAIAGRVGIPIGTVRSRLNRSREALRQILGHENEEEDR